MTNQPTLADLLRQALQAALRENNKDAYRRIQEILAYVRVSDANLKDVGDPRFSEDPPATKLPKLPP